MLLDHSDFGLNGASAASQPSLVMIGRSLSLWRQQRPCSRFAAKPFRAYRRVGFLRTTGEPCGGCLGACKLGEILPVASNARPIWHIQLAWTLLGHFHCAEVLVCVLNALTSQPSVLRNFTGTSDQFRTLRKTMKQ